MLIKRQAVVVIHGIGEQKPMSTIRDFVYSISNYSKHKDQFEVYNIPDTMSEGYELRLLALYKGKELRTDFYEYYWANNMRGTKVGTVFTWIFKLLFRKPKEIPTRVKWLYYLVWILTLLYAVSIVAGLTVWIGNLQWIKLPIVVFLGSLLVHLLTSVFTMYIGDAARYTYASPDNVEERNKIRKGGIDLLTKLHQEKKYERIIIIGHSLGSMIGYDMLKQYWAKVYRNYTVRSNYQREVLDVYNEMISSGTKIQNDEQRSLYLKLQDKLLKEQQNRGNPWLVSDFITLGSPLAHGELLMAEKKQKFKGRIEEREFPTNPPEPDSNGGISYSQPFTVPDSNPQQSCPMDIIHHAGHFAFTQWHNLYYQRDYVGGPLQSVLGSGIVDTMVHSKSWKAKVPFLMHTNYWGGEGSTTEMQESMEYLKNIIMPGTSTMAKS